MRLVIATPLYPPEIGGPATYAQLLREGLPKKDIEVVVVKFSEVRHLPKLIRHYAYYRRVCAALRHADAVLALDPISVGLPALHAAKKARKPFVVKIVGDYAWEQGRQRFGVKEDLDEFVRTKSVPFPTRLLRLVQTYVARSAAKIIVPSEYLKNIVAAWGIPREQIKVIYNAVLPEELGAVHEAIATLPRPLVVTAGRLVPWKHMEGVIDAVARTSGVSLAIIGDGPERAALAQRAGEKLPARAALTGALPHARTLAAIKSADVFALNSSYEGLSHLLVEAQTLGVPTVATNVGGNPEVITDGGNGLLVPAGDTQALATAIVRILSDAELRTRLQTAAVESSRRFSTEAMLTATATLMLGVRNPTSKI